MISSTDLKIGITVSTPIESEDNFKVAVPAKIVSELISQLPQGKIEFLSEKNCLVVVSSQSRSSIKCFEVEDYPLFPQKEGLEVKIEREKLMAAIASTSFAAGVDETRPILTATLFSLKKDSLTCVTTDGYRLSHIEVPHQIEDEIEVLLPTKALSEVVRICTKHAQSNVSVTLSDKLKQAFFTFQDTQVIVRMMEGEFPPYQKIFPTEFQTKCTFDGEEFLRCLKVALVFTKDSSGVIKLEVMKDTLKISTTSATVGEQEGTIPIELICGGNQEIAFNSRYVMDFLSTYKPEKIFFGMNESLRPALMRPEDRPETSYLLMPFRVNK